MKFIKELHKKAKDIAGTIILPEANLDKRVYEAAKKILKYEISNIIVFGKFNEFDKDFNNPRCTIIDIENYKDLAMLTNELYELRKEKGLTMDDAKKLILDAGYFAMMLLKKGVADGVVAGAKWSTAQTLRPALQIIKTKKGKSCVTGSVLFVRDKQCPLLYGDCSLIENPDAEKLSEIAISNAEFMEKVIGETPKVAMLSYSTKGSAKHEMVDKVVNATNLAKSKCNYLIDGEMQGDSALEADTAKKKGITSEVGGNANVLIFPDLNAGNIGYKLTATFGGFLALGPIMLNFNKPVNDLSRGCTVDEIINTVCITKLQQ